MLGLCSFKQASLEPVSLLHVWIWLMRALSSANTQKDLLTAAA